MNRLFFIFLSLLVFQARSLEATFSIVYESKASKDALHALLLEIPKKVVSKIPQRFHEHLKKYDFQIMVSAHCPRDGFFQEPKISGNKISGLCLKPDLLGTSRALEILAHELFHAFHFIIYPDEPTWMREGLAQWFSFRVTGYFPAGTLQNGMARSTTSLRDDYDYEKNTAKDKEKYAHHFLYFYYLWNQCGGDELIWKIIGGNAERIKGAQGIGQVLQIFWKKNQAKEQCFHIKESALFFEIARFHNRTLDENSPNKFRFQLKHLLSAHTKKVLSQVNEEILKTLPSYQPIFLSSNQSLNNLKDDSFSVAWMKQSHPFNVIFSLEAPAQTSDWVGLFMKM